MNGDFAQVLLSSEAEAYVESLKTYDVKEIGNPKWTVQHGYLEKLNMQAVLSASTMEDEFIKEFLITHDKITVLIKDLLATEIWKQNVFPQFVNLGLEQNVIFPVYMVLYHEATVTNLLETVMYHRDSCEAAEDAVLDLIDYCYRKLTILSSKAEEEEEEEEPVTDISSFHSANQATTLEELEKQNRSLEFDICIKALSILRYITDNLSSLPLSASTRILNTHDLPILLVHLTESPPWTRTKDGQLQKYVDSKWVVVPHTERFKLTKIEGQVWIALFHLLMEEDCQKKYDISNYRKNIIMKLRSHLTEVLLDQMPVLVELHRYVEQLSFMDPPPAKKELVLEQVPEIRDKILNENAGKWKKIAKFQSDNYFNPSKVDMRAQAQRLADTYNLDVMESLITEPPKCAQCGEPAAKRCSRCQNEWYCRRECQVQNWKKHKSACNLLVDALKKVKEAETQSQTTVKT